MPTKTCLSTNRGEVLCAIAILALLLAHTAAVAAGSFCTCSVCCSGGSCGREVLYESGIPAASRIPGGAAMGDPFQIATPWLRTATDGFRGSAPGRPVTLTWGFVDDGTTVFDGSNQGSSSLLSSLNNAFGTSPTGDVQQAPWFRLFDEAIGRWAELSGITFNYESADSGVTIASGGSQGVLGQNADIRIAGRPIPRDEGNVLAFNFFPSVGDMVIDTDDLAPGGFLTNPSGDFRALRNVIAHEIGHGLGIQHLESSNSVQLLEPFLSLSIDGPQVAEILAVHRLYGDAREAGTGNDSVGLADELGVFGEGDSFALGTDGGTLVVSPDQTDFVSIDGTSDTDVYRFTVDEEVLANLDLTQVGRSYLASAEGEEQESLVDNSLRNELKLQLLTFNTEGVLTASAEATQLGNSVSRSIDDVLLRPGEEYFLQVTGTLDDVQLYELGLSFAAVAVPEPGALALLLACATTCCGRRRLDVDRCRAA